MAQTAVDIVVKVVGDQKLKRLETSLKGTAAQSVKASTNLDKSAQSAKRLGVAADKAKTGVNNLAGAVKGLLGAAAVLATTRFVIGKTAELETQTRSLKVLTGELKTAEEIIKRLQKFAAVTPFTSSELIETSKRLAAFGVDTEKLVETTKRLADVSGATGARLTEVATAYGQIQAKGRLQGEELLQLQERGIALQDELQKMYGLTGEEFSKALQKGQFSAKAAEVAIKRLTEAGGKYANGAISQSDTLAGKFSTLIDGIENIARTLGNVLSPALKTILDQAIGVVNSINEALAAGRRMQQFGIDSKQRDELFRQAGKEAEEIARMRGGGRIDPAEFTKLRNERFKDLIEAFGYDTGQVQVEVKPVLAENDIPELLKGNSADKTKSAQDRIKKVKDFSAKNAQALADQQSRLNRQVFEDALRLEALKYQKQTEYANKLADVQREALSPTGRSLFGGLQQFQAGVQQREAELRQLRQDRDKAAQNLEALKNGRTPIAESTSLAGSSNAQAVLQAAEKNIGLMAGSSERCADALRELFKQTGIGIGVTKKAWDGLASSGRLASSFFGSDIGKKITNIRDLRPGDLVGFEQTYGSWGKGVQTHVGIYAGDGMMFDHSSSKGLTKRSMQGTFPGKFMYGVRPDAYGQQADMSGLIKRDGMIQQTTQELAGLNDQIAAFEASMGKMNDLDFEKTLLTQTQLFTDQTMAVERQLEAFQLRNRLAEEGVSETLIEGELKKLEVSNELKDATENYAAALKAGVINEDQYNQLLNNATVAAEGKANAIDRLTAAQEQYNEQLKLQQQIESIASGISSAMTQAIGDVVKGTKSIEEAFSDMLTSIGNMFIDMALKILQDAITQQLIKLFSGLLGGFGGGGGFNPNPLGGLNFSSPVGFANGGMPEPNSVSIVGERGPELLLTGNYASRVLPNDVFEETKDALIDNDDDVATKEDEQAAAMASNNSSINNTYNSTNEVNEAEAAKALERNNSSINNTYNSTSSAFSQNSNAISNTRYGNSSNTSASEAFAINNSTLQSQQLAAATALERESMQQILTTPSKMNFTYESTVINEQHYVSTEQHQKGLAMAAKKGRDMAIASLKNSVRARKEVGMA